VFLVFSVLMSWLRRRRRARSRAAQPTVSAANEELKTEIAERTKPDEKLRRSEASLLEGQILVHVCSWNHDALSGIVTSSPEDALTAEWENPSRRSAGCRANV
jgi:C4-dicarboxylate-specific signal transduction histidine kinase